MTKLFEKVEETSGKRFWKKKTGADISILDGYEKQVVKDDYIDINNIISANWDAYLEYYYSSKEEQKMSFSEWLDK
jgi:hypothetical protein